MPAFFALLPVRDEADVFVSASLIETYGLILVEAMACGTPVVAFRVGRIPEAGPDGKGAILCAPQDGAAVIEAIMKLRDSPQLRDSLGNAGHQTVLTRNALRAFAQAFMGVYEECVRPVKTLSANRTALVT
jgi:glycosyltransferase involved in cell wall biosynthesis